MNNIQSKINAFIPVCLLGKMLRSVALSPKTFEEKFSPIEYTTEHFRIDLQHNKIEMLKSLSEATAIVGPALVRHHVETQLKPNLKLIYHLLWYIIFIY